MNVFARRQVARNAGAHIAPPAPATEGVMKTDRRTELFNALSNVSKFIRGVDTSQKPKKVVEQLQSQLSDAIDSAAKRPESFILNVGISKLRGILGTGIGMKHDLVTKAAKLSSPAKLAELLFNAVKKKDYGNKSIPIFSLAEEITNGSYKSWSRKDGISGREITYAEDCKNAQKDMDDLKVAFKMLAEAKKTLGDNEIADMVRKIQVGK